MEIILGEKMSDLVLFCLAAIGATHIVVDGKIFKPFRDFVEKYLPEKIYELVSCYQCSGTYVGFVLGYLTYGPDLSKIFLAGCASSVLSNLMALYMNYLEAKTIINLEEDKK